MNDIERLTQLIYGTGTRTVPHNDVFIAVANAVIELDKRLAAIEKRQVSANEGANVITGIAYHKPPTPDYSKYYGDWDETGCGRGKWYWWRIDESGIRAFDVSQNRWCERTVATMNFAIKRINAGEWTRIDAPNPRSRGEEVAASIRNLYAIDDDRAKAVTAYIDAEIDRAVKAEREATEKDIHDTPGHYGDRRLLLDAIRNRGSK